MAAGSIVINLLMKTGSFETDTKRAEKALAQFQKQAAAAGAVIGTAIAAGVGIAVAAFEHFTGVAAEFKDLEEQVGASAEELASLSIIAGVVGTSVADMAGQMNKLTKNLSGVDDESKAAGAALSALGLPIDEFKKLNPVEQIDALAKAFGGFADGSTKTAVAMALFGKQGAAMLSVFKELEAEGGRQVILTQAQIELADDYKDRQAKLTATLKAYAAAAATEVIPALNDLTTAAKEVVAEITGIDSAGRKMDVSPIQEWAEMAVDAFAQVVEAGQLVGLVFNVTGKTIGAYVAVSKALLSGQVEEAKRIGAEYRADVDQTLNMTELFTDRLARIRAAAKRSRESDPNQSDAESRRLARRPDLNFSGAAKKDKVAKEAKQSEAEKYLETLQKQIEKTGDLSAQETALAEIQAGRLKGITPELEIEILQTAQLLDYTMQLKELRDGEVATNTNIGKAQAAELDGILKTNAALREEVDAIGLSKEELAAKELQLVRVTRAEKESTLAKKEAAGVDETQLQVLRAEIDALREKEDLLGQRADKTAEDEGKKFADKTAESTQTALADSIEQGILDGFRKGSSLTDIFLNELKAQFAKTILRPIIQPVADAGNQAIGQILGQIGSLFGGFSGSPIVSGGSSESATGAYIAGRRASGGPVSAGMPYMVGERGPEVFTPNTAGRVLPNGALGGNRTNVIIENHGARIEKRDDGQGNIRLIIEAAVAEVDRRIASGTGSTASAMKSRGLSLDGALPRRA